MLHRRRWQQKNDSDRADGMISPSDADELDLTPMVDVTFLLLIFFMITASFALQSTLGMPPPEQAGDAAANPIVEPDVPAETRVQIDARNVVTVDGVVTETARLSNVLVTKRSTAVLIATDAMATHETLVKVLDAAQEAGMQRIKVAVASEAP